MQNDFLQSSQVRVLVNAIHAKSGGGVTYLRNMLPILAEDDELEIHLFLHRDQFELFGFLSERIQLHLLDFDSGFFASLMWEQFVLPLLARSMSVDVTLSPANYGPLWAPNQVIVLRNSLAVVGRETRFVRRFYWAGLALMTLLSLMTCRRAVAVSQYAKNTLTFGIGRQIGKKVTVIGHGITDTFRPDAAAKREDFILVVSDIYIQKNIHMLVEAVAKIRETYPSTKVIVAGRAIDKDYLQELRTQIAELGLDSSFEFVGEKTATELVMLYRTCRLFVFPSTVETFGNPLVEAMACGAPIACSNTAAMPEVVGDAATYFSPLDPEEIAETILAVINDPEQLEILSKKSLIRAKNYSWKATANQTARILKEAAGKRYQAPSIVEAGNTP